MEHAIHGKHPVDLIFIPKPPTTPQNWFVHAVHGVEIQAPMPVLVFAKAKKLDEYGFEWEYHFLKEQ